MDVLLRLVFLLLTPFIGHPERAVFVAVAFLSAMAISIARGRARLRRQLIVLSASVAWILFAIEEGFAMQHGWNIRVDLLLIGPVLLMLSLAAIWTIIRSGRDAAIAKSMWQTNVGRRR